MVKDEGKLIKNSFAKSIVELKLASDRLAEGIGLGSGVFSIKYQVLYLIASLGTASPAELICELNMAKSNLALIAKKLVKEELIERVKSAENKKQIYYKITDKGSVELNKKLQAIENLNVRDSKMLAHLAETVENLKKLK